MKETHYCLICRPLPDRYGPSDAPLTGFIWSWEFDRYLVAPLPTYPDQAALAAHLLAAHGLTGAPTEGRPIRERYHAHDYSEALTCREASGRFEVALVLREGAIIPWEDL